MSSGVVVIALFALLVLMIALGWSIRRRLPDDHVSGESKDGVKAAMGLVATMTALLLGLLVGAAKDTYDAQRIDVIQMASDVALLDRTLAMYGSSTESLRVLLKESVDEARQQIWLPTASPRHGSFTEVTHAADVYGGLHDLPADSELKADLKAKALARADSIAHLRAMMVAQSAPSVALPLLGAVSMWLAIIFFGFSLVTPPNITTGFALAAAAVSVAGAVFLVLEFDRPFTGMIRVSDAPLMNAVQHIAESGK